MRPTPYSERVNVKTWVRRMWSYHQIRYVVVAGCTSLFYLALVAAGLSLRWHYMLAILAAQAVTIACAFPAYRSLVFESGGRPLADFVRFLSVWSTGAVAGVVATPLLVELVGMDPLIAQVVAIVVVAVGSYLGHRFFSFSDSDVSPHSGVPQGSETPRG